MGVGLQPLEFTECLADSPHFRENLQRHEKELEQTSQQIKRLIKEVKDVVSAAKRLGAAQVALATSMEQFEFAFIGASMTEDERVIGRSLHHFAGLIRTIEAERDRMLGRAHDQIIQPLERFRKEHIGAVKEGKKKFDKKTAKFCQTQERTLSLSARKQENVFQEADAAMDMAERDFCQASLEYVFQLQAVQERKKFELVETLLCFVFGWWTFHHTAHDVHHDAEPLVRDLQLRIQRTRSNFEETSKQTESLMKKMMEVRQLSKEEEHGGGEEAAGGGGGGGGGSRAGYLFLMEKKAFGTAWTKQYCTYEKSSKLLSLMPYNQINVKSTSPPESVCLCGARCADAAERRFCWEAVPADRERAPLTLQALSEADRAAWLRAVDCAPPSARGGGAGGGGGRRRVAAGRGGVRVRAAAGGERGGARPGRAGAVPRGGRGEPRGAPGGGGAPARARARCRRRRRRPAGRRAGHAHAHLGAQELPARAARARAHAPPAPPVHRRRQVREPRGAGGRGAGAGARAAARPLRDAQAGHHAPAQGGGAQRSQPDDGVQPGGVLRADAAARRARDRGLHPRPEVLQRAGGDAARPRHVPGRRRPRPRAHTAARRLPPTQRRRPPPRPRALLAAPAPAAAAVRAARPQRRARARARARLAARAARRGPLEQQLGGVGVELRRVPSAGRRGGRAGRRAGRGGGARAHAVRLPRRERGRAVVRAQPDHHQRGALARAGLAARHAQREDGPRALQLRRAAAVRRSPARPRRPRRPHRPHRPRRQPSPRYTK